MSSGNVNNFLRVFWFICLFYLETTFFNLAFHMIEFISMGLILKYLQTQIYVEETTQLIKSLFKLSPLLIIWPNKCCWYMQVWPFRTLQFCCTFSIISRGVQTALNEFSSSEIEKRCRHLLWNLKVVDEIVWDFFIDF